MKHRVAIVSLDLYNIGRWDGLAFLLLFFFFFFWAEELPPRSTPLFVGLNLTSALLLTSIKPTHRFFKYAFMYNVTINF